MLFKQVSALGQYMISACFNAGVVTPGVTTTDDLVWHYWQHARDLGLDLAFLPYLQDSARRARDALSAERDQPRRRDPLRRRHQISAAELRPPASRLRPAPRRNRRSRRAEEADGRHERPAGHLHGRLPPRRIRQRDAAGHAQAARAAGLQEPRIYSHNLGLFLHQPGPLIGLPWEQENTGPRGDVRLEYDSAFVMELSTDGPVPEWGGQILRLEMEEPVIFTRDGCRTLCGRQTEFHVI